MPPERHAAVCLVLLQLRCGEAFDGEGADFYDALRGRSYWSDGATGTNGPALSWVIVGSESGPRARPMDIDWARNVVGQCVATHVPVFTKQIANEADKKGGNPAYWPPGTWPRQWPQAQA